MSNVIISIFCSIVLPSTLSICCWRWIILSLAWGQWSKYRTDNWEVMGLISSHGITT